MTMTSNGQRDIAATGDATGLTDADAALLARADWHASGGTLTGRELAERYGRSPRWGQKQRAAAEAEAAGGAVPGVVAAQLGVPRPDTPPVAPVPRSDRKRQPAARVRHVEAGTPLLLRTCKDVGCAVVIVVCAVLSYNHIRALAIYVGLADAAWVPLGIDGLMAVTTCSLMIDKRAGRVPLLAARVGLALGIVGTLVANALAVNPSLDLDTWSIVRMALACYPPAAVAVVLHLVFFRRSGDR